MADIVSKLCNGNVAPSRFVKEDSSTTAGFVLAAGATDTPFGISQEGVMFPPMGGLDNGFAGIQNGPPISVYINGSECWLELGGTVSYGDFLKPSTNGVGVTASSDGDIYGAMAEESGVSGNLIRVRVVSPSFRGA
jgi:hypothetical protein